ncbi:transposase [Ligilactobacillus equi DPC 6820]|uniref:Transposase n=1 Tax=Ligilactobacillus equi DPC 6820 TaxID=1392007 RepID=V7HXN9_9LACO|nr:transposase [Ligilactobacillus equi DPC 6820]
MKGAKEQNNYIITI